MELTYGYTKEEGLEEDIVIRDVLQDVSVIRDIDQDCQGVLCYRLSFPKVRLVPQLVERAHSTHSVVLDQ